MLPMIVGLQKLREEAQALGLSPLIVDTTGLIDARAGGVALKEWKLALLRPTAVVVEGSPDAVVVRTPLRDLSEIHVLRFGALRVDPVTGHAFD